MINALRKKRNGGFTLLELLVVISIIGLLAAIIFSSLTTARNKSRDTAIRSNLVNARAQANLFYEANGGTYDATVDVCDSTAVGGVDGMGKFIDAAKTAAGIVTATGRDAAGAAGTATCNDTATGFAIQVPRVSSGYVCIDSAGQSLFLGANGLSSGTDISCL